MKLCFTVEKSTLKRNDENLIVSYAKGINKCIFHCNCFWEDLYKKALFVDYTNKQYIVDLGFGERVSCIIPDDVLKGNFFSISVFGENTSIFSQRYTTTQETIYIQPSGFTEKTEDILINGESEVEGDSLLNDFDVHRFNNCNCKNLYYRDVEHLYY